MTVLKHEIKSGRVPLIIWAAAVAFLLSLCIFIYPEMAGQMDELSETFSRMGEFSQAFGMDQISFGEFTDFFGVECGNVLGLGGAFFAALLGISALAKEEKEHTAEFLLTHPRSRISIITEKLLAVIFQIVVFNIIVIAVAAVSIVAVGESPEIKKIALLFAAYFILQIETACICFGISAFIRRGAPGIGLGIAAMFYFLSIIANLTENAEFLKYITPFGYASGADIIAKGSLRGEYIAVGAAIAAVSTVSGFVKYSKKDIA